MCTRSKVSPTHPPIHPTACSAHGGCRWLNHVPKRPRFLVLWWEIGYLTLSVGVGVICKRSYAGILVWKGENESRTFQWGVTYQKTLQASTQTWCIVQSTSKVPTERFSYIFSGWGRSFSCLIFFAEWWIGNTHVPWSNILNVRVGQLYESNG